MKILVIGNCQAAPLADIMMRLKPGLETRCTNFSAARETLLEKTGEYGENDVILIQNTRSPDLSELRLQLENFAPTVLFPNVVFSGLFPDYTEIPFVGKKARSGYHSNIILNAFLHDIPSEKVSALFNIETVNALGYTEIYRTSRNWLEENLNECKLEGEYYLDKWLSRGVFLFTRNHPQVHVIADIARAFLDRLDIAYSYNLDIECLINEPFKEKAIFPAFIPGQEVRNSLLNRNHVYRIGRNIFSLDQFIAHEYDFLQKNISDLTPNSAQQARFGALLKAETKRKEVSASLNPYKSRPNYAFWTRSISRVDPEQVDPATAMQALITNKSKVATAGSCFAQHISRTLQRQGLNFLISEGLPGETNPANSQNQGYGIFSCRYGNIYTARQLRQLAERACSRFIPEIDHWESKEEGFLDPFRARATPPFRTIEEMQEDRCRHLQAVNKMLRTLDVFIFTLGLTETWVHSPDGSVLPLAPGVISRHSTIDEYSFTNFSYQDVVEDLELFLELLKSLNPGARVILTVSPVPLAATYEDQHVLTATSRSKAILRAAAGHMSRCYECVTYFPSYEIVTGVHNGNRYFESDMRSVKPEGVNRVMDIFLKNIVTNKNINTEPPEAKAISRDGTIWAELDSDAQVDCDEDLLDPENL